MDKRKADKKEIKYLWLSLVCFFSLLLLGLNIFNYVFTLNRVSLFLREATQTGEGKFSGFRRNEYVCAVSFQYSSFLFSVEWKKNKIEPLIPCAVHQTDSYLSRRYAKADGDLIWFIVRRLMKVWCALHIVSDLMPMMCEFHQIFMSHRQERK